MLEANPISFGIFGPAAPVVDNGIAAFDGTTGRKIQSRLVTIDDDGNIVMPDGASLSLQEAINFTGATTENQIKFPDNLAVALDFMESTNSYMKFVTTNDSEGITMEKTVTLSASTIVPANGVIGVTDGNPQIVFDNANNWLEITGNAGIGTTPGLTIAGGVNQSSLLHLRTDAGNTDTFTMEKQVDSGQPIASFNRARNGVAAVVDGDITGLFIFRAHDGTDYNSGAYFGAKIDGAVSSNNVPTALYFATTATNSPTERMRISPAGNLGIGAITFGANMAGGMAIALGTDPTADVADQFAFWAKDFAAGNTCPYFRTENGTIIGLNQSLLDDDNVTFLGLALTGGFKANLVTKTGAYTTTADDYTILCDASSGSFTITLIALASHLEGIYHIKKIDSSANTVTLDGNSAETIEGSSTLVLTVEGESVTIQAGSEWGIL